MNQKHKISSRQKLRILNLRRNPMSFSRIAREMGLPLQVIQRIVQKGFAGVHPKKTVKPKSHQ